jgi:hypothetical protein
MSNHEAISKTVSVFFPVDVQHADAGLFYVTSPLVRGLLASGKTEADALAKVSGALAKRRRRLTLTGVLI